MQQESLGTSTKTRHRKESRDRHLKQQALRAHPSSFEHTSPVRRFRPLHTLFTMRSVYWPQPCCNPKYAGCIADLEQNPG